MPKHFIRVKENFTCQHCGEQVIGTGFTNHCPSCLYSLHVDLEVPGDRLAVLVGGAGPCQGLMKPIAVTKKSDQLIIHHQCVKCHKRISNKSAPNDNQDLLLELSGNPLTSPTN